MTLQEYTDAIQARLDKFAQTRGYDNMLSACTYATSQMGRFRNEGLKACYLREATWMQAYAILDDVQAGKRPAPSLEELFMELPELTWELPPVEENPV